ncbi:hydrolase TatD [Chryseobacterium lactis]|uniref:Hydrolase TatD n=1 Tax=Chryseobacterium lactis TaxID=1241981 RepID=A0A3G6RSB9_CHRLC|nr:TatD family hydrolase [Chryseobacterium lactis]AZA81168.1 hydrolase TatD [Chryseobacterium lactis]AZB06169.1 hydrolase TatD [Chryseobacterium lactis]PNW15019.1 hydrolase TatD [Chryseobacterium lactis]
MEFFDFHHHKKDTQNGIYNLNFGETPPDIPYSVGIHPQDIDRNHVETQLEWMKNMISENCFAIGECGLDSLVQIDQKIQEDIFLQQIRISNEVKKPIIVHCVRKFYEVISFKKNAEQPMIIHGFNKKQRIADDLLSHNFYLSFGKAVLYHLSLQDILKNTPINKIFLETDNEDFKIEELYQKVSEIKDISLEQLKEQILENLHTIKNG